MRVRGEFLATLLSEVAGSLQVDDLLPMFRIARSGHQVLPKILLSADQRREGFPGVCGDRAMMRLNYASKNE